MTIRVLGAIALFCLCGQALAAQPQANAERKAAQRAAFLRGDASTKAAPKPQPQTEAEAVAERTVLPNGIIEMELPEDRMLELTAIRNADGTISIGHHDLDVAPVAKKEASRD